MFPWGLIREWRRRSDQQLRLLRIINERNALINLRLKIMTKELDQLELDVEANTTVVDSAVTLIEGLSQQIKDAGTDPARLAAITTKLDASKDKLAASVAANTVADGETPAP